jgi:hypothetical protein
LTDHEGMSDWLEARVSVIAGPGDGGVGTVRRVSARGLSIDEEVTYAVAPRRLSYRIVRGLPGLSYHRGEVLIEPWGKTGSQLTWDVILASPIPGIAPIMGASLRGPLRAGLATLRTWLAA